tara:strand:- start:52 stop:339 length:288 start_codon:yes stop_codon:yes gene_type:complete
MKQFFNTTNESGIDLQLAIQKAKNQNDRIYKIMQQNSEPMTPFEVQSVYELIFPSVPITSIRRAMSTLTDNGQLVKTENMKVEQYGAKNHLWRVV